MTSTNIPYLHFNWAFLIVLVTAGAVVAQSELNAPLSDNADANEAGIKKYSILNRPSSDERPSGSMKSDSSSHEANTETNEVPALNRLLTKIILDHMPHHYVDEKKWGGQTRRWNGIKLRRDEDGGRLETKRKYKMVNHGTWKKYSAELIDPDRDFSATLNNLRNSQSGSTAFDVSFNAKIKIHARQSKWVKGIQLYSVSVDGSANVRMKLECELKTRLDFSKLPPDIVFEPLITDANIFVDDFRVDRVSKAGGEFAQQVTRAAKKKLDEKVKEKEKKLVTKLNQKLDSSKDKMRLSIADAVKSKWYDKSKEFLPNDVQDALSEGNH